MAVSCVSEAAVQARPAVCCRADAVKHGDLHRGLEETPGQASRFPVCAPRLLQIFLQVSSLPSVAF